MNRTEPESYQDFETLPARVVGVIRSPRALFASVIARPRWLAVMLLTWLVTTGCNSAFMQTAVGQQALVDQWERTAFAFGQLVSDEQYESFVAMSRRGALYGAATALAGAPGLTIVIAGVMHAVSRAAGWAAGTYRQALAVAAHAGVILMLRQIVVTPLNYWRETTASPTTLTLIVPALDEASPVARFLGAVDLFVVWWAIGLGIGAALLYRRRMQTLVLGMVGTYVVIAALLAAAMVVSGGKV